jgi:hypothetical protein
MAEIQIDHQRYITRQVIWVEKPYNVTLEKLT